MDIDQLYQIYLQHPEICTDSRKIVHGCLFFALKGDAFDGNQFAVSALHTGASYAIVDDITLASVERCIIVDDVLSCLQKLASFHRKQLNIPVLGITGSNGKTTTKELCRDVLQKKYITKATLGNLNNHIGVPLTILSTKSDIEFLIVEMGANHQGEIGFLCEIAHPGFVGITNIGKAHLDGFGGEDGIKKGKSEIYKYAFGNQGFIFLNNEDNVLASLIPVGSKIISYSLSDLIQITKEEPLLSFKYRGIDVDTQLFGSYNIPNIGFAIAVGEYFGVETREIATAIASYTPDNNRSQVVKSGTNIIIKDAYNANPSSMKLSIESFYKMEAKNKMLVLGDMLELGEFTVKEHKSIIELTKRLGFRNIIFVGPHFYETKDDEHGKYFTSIDDAKKYIHHFTVNDTVVLLKGSRGIGVEKILSEL